MSTGSVAPFVPTQPTQSVAPSNTTNSLFTFNQCDSLLIWNAGTVLCFGAFGNSITQQGTSPAIVGGFPIPPTTLMLVGVPGEIGNQANPTNQLAILASASSAGTVYVTPGLGTQH